MGRPVALTVEQQTPNLMVGGSNPSWPAKGLRRDSFSIKSDRKESRAFLFLSCFQNVLDLKGES